MKEQLEAIRQEAEAALQTCTDAKQLDAIRVQYLGKKGALTAILKQMGKLSAEERPVMGQLANAVRSDIESAITKQQAAIAEAALEQKAPVGNPGHHTAGQAEENRRSASADHRGKRNQGNLPRHGLFCCRWSGSGIRLL